MNLIEQPEHSCMCGHAVVAMLSNTTVGRVACVLQHGRPTAWRELHSVLFVFGVVCESELLPVLSADAVPSCAVLALPARGRYGHWVVVERGVVYDPAGAVYPVCELRFHGPGASNVIMCGAVLNRVIHATV